MSQDAIYTGVRAFVLSLIQGVEVVQGLGNNVPMPADAFIALTAVAQARLRTNVSTYDTIGNTRTVEQGTSYSIQVDCYGPMSSDQATTICAMWRDEYAFDMLKQYGCTPLYTSDPTQAALVNGEENYEQRWTLTAVLQFNPSITVPQQFADALQVGFATADTPTN